MKRILLTSLVLTIGSGCGGEPYAEVSGSVDGYSLEPQTLYWGGPFLVMANESLDCMDMSWVKRGTNFRDGDEAPLDENIVALLFTYESDEVVAQNTSLEGDAPVDARLLVARDGALAVYKADAGELNVTEFTKQDDVIGTFVVDIEDEGFSGEFQLEWCNNLKTRY